MKRFLIVLALCALLLTGCSMTEIACGVDEGNQAFLTVSFQADWTEADETVRRELKTGCELLAKHYRDKLGFQVEEAYTETGCNLELSMVRQANSRAEAFAELEAMLTDEKLTPFLNVGTEHTVQGAVDGYAVDLTLDTGGIVNNLGLEYFPGDIQRFFRDGIAESKATMMVRLPGTELVEGPEGASCEQGMVEGSVNVDVGGQTEVKLAAITQTERDRLTSEIQSRQTGMIVSGAVLALGVLIVVVLLLCRKRPPRTPREPEIPES